MNSTLRSAIKHFQLQQKRLLPGELMICRVVFSCERFEPRSLFKSRLSLNVRVNVVLNRTVVVDSD